MTFHGTSSPPPAGAHSGPSDPTVRGDDPAGLQHLQRRKLAALLDVIRAGNRFYQAKLAGVAFGPLVDPLDRLPFTTRAELEADQLAHPPYGTNLSFPVERYCRFHQTSGTGGRPMRWLDTAGSWDWFKSCWRTIFAAAGVGPGDRVLFPFSFGPFVGFWAAFDGAVSLGAMAIPAGGMSTLARLQLIAENAVTVICCTPTYGLRMADAASEANIGIGRSLRAVIVAGEPGGSIPEVRRGIECGFAPARVFDHHGMTEMGPASFECRESPGGLHVNEAEFIPEVIDPATGQILHDDGSPDGVAGELVLTNLGRTGSPLIRYRTGDRVRLVRGRRCACGRWYARLAGGILGRADDMFTVRGNNVFPTAVEAIVRRFPVAEFRLTVYDRGPMTEARLEVEPEPGPVDAATLCRRVADAVHDELHFRAEVTAVAPGALPRFEMKAKRFVRVRPDEQP